MLNQLSAAEPRRELPVKDDEMQEFMEPLFKWSLNKIKRCMTAIENCYVVFRKRSGTWVVFRLSHLQRSGGEDECIWNSKLSPGVF